jgi:hypothetical protein
MGKTGHRSTRGKGEIYPEPKDQRQMVLLTATGKGILQRLALARSISLSEAVEQLLRKNGDDHDVATDQIES